MTVRNVESPYLFEVSWEVVNKVGGIHTVIKSKAPVTVDEYGLDSYFMVGPYRACKASTEFEELTCRHPQLAETLESMRREGVHVRFGRWLIEGHPYVLLIDLLSCLSRLNEWKGDLWNSAGIGSGIDDYEMNDSVLFGYCVAWLIGDFEYRLRQCSEDGVHSPTSDRKILWLNPKDRDAAVDMNGQVAFRDAENEPSVPRAIVVHFHEWQAGVGLVLLRKRQIPVATLFTTHATLLGRYLCAGGESLFDFYGNLHRVHVDEEAGKRGIYHRYCLERAASHLNHVFTTVSHITAFEAECLLKRRPDGILPNGLNVTQFSAMHEFQNLHAESKKKLHHFVEGHFYGQLTEEWDLDRTLYFFIAGRYEYRNKGVDVFLEALKGLNDQLKHFNSPMTVVVFIVMPAANASYTLETLKGQAIVRKWQESVLDLQQKLGKKIYTSILQGKMPTDSLLDDTDKMELKRNLRAMQRGNALPPVVTHNMLQDASDPILCQIRNLGLFNAPSDKVKVLFHPEFISPNNPILSMEYEEFVRGCHLGIFPSYYEPWGYTPAECTVLGIPSITTNLSGFGSFIEEILPDSQSHGLYILDRKHCSPGESIQRLTDLMFQFCAQSRRQRINQRNRVERLSEVLDWKRLGLEYQKARFLALYRAFPEMFPAIPNLDQASSDNISKSKNCMTKNGIMDGSLPDLVSPSLESSITFKESSLNSAFIQMSLSRTGSIPSPVSMTLSPKPPIDE